MQKTAVRAGLVLCAVVIVATVVLLALRVEKGPRTVHRDPVPCPAGSSQTTCTDERYTGSPVARPWLIVGIALSVCAGGVALSLREELRRLNGAVPTWDPPSSR